MTGSKTRKCSRLRASPTRLSGISLHQSGGQITGGGHGRRSLKLVKQMLWASASRRSGFPEARPLLQLLQLCKAAPVRWRSAVGAHETAAPNLSEATQGPSFLPPPTSHTSLATFLEYARRTELSPSSTVFIGTHYEYTCQAALTRLGFSLTRTGGRDDAGIDLLGTWKLPGNQQLPCLVQCKALSRKAPSRYGIGPREVREIEGVFAGAPSGWRGERCVGVLCAGREATRGVREAVRRSRRGLIWVYVEETVGKDHETEVGAPAKVRQLLWNEQVASMGAEGVNVDVKYVSPDSSEKEVVLTYKDEIWQPAVP